MRMLQTICQNNFFKSYISLFLNRNIVAIFMFFNILSCSFVTAADDPFGDEAAHYHIVSKHTGKALDLGDASVDWVKKLPLVPIDLTVRYHKQFWKIQPVNGYYQIIHPSSKNLYFSDDSEQVSEQVLDSSDNGVKWVIKHDTYSPKHKFYDRQLWQIHQVNDGYFQIISKYSGKALDSYSNDVEWVGKHAPHPAGHAHYDHQLWTIEKTELMTNY